MPTNKGKLVPAIAQTIDTVLDTNPAKQVVRPLASLRPSWIGPSLDRPRTPGVEAMKQPVTVEYSSPSLQPPVYIFTSLSDPQWEAVEMQVEKDDGGEYRFTKTFQAEEGEYQYKFRLGPGDWWVCDESKPTVDDGMGNKNNLLVFKPQQTRISRVDSAVPSTPATTSLNTPPSSPATSAEAAKSMTPRMISPPASPPSTPNPQSKFDNHQDSTSQQTPENEADDPFFLNSLPDNDSDPNSTNYAPLLPHEAVTPDTPSHAPLFRHESITLENNCHDMPSSCYPDPTIGGHDLGPAIAREATEEDFNDPNVVQFPTERAAVLELCRQLHVMHVEEARAGIARRPSSTSKVLNALGSLREDFEGDEEVLGKIRAAEEEEELEELREVEEEEYEREEESGEEVDPLRDEAAAATSEPEDADLSPKPHGWRESEASSAPEVVVVEVDGKRRSSLDEMADLVGGRTRAVAIAMGLLVLAAGIASLQFV